VVSSALMLSQPLYFGGYGGLGLKLVWLLLDLFTILVLVTGLVLWWKRRHQTIAVAPLPRARHERTPE
jgi:uncharacterized iron-regulated membrane protein